MQTEADSMKMCVKYCLAVLFSLAAITSNAAVAGPAKDGLYIGAAYVSNNIGEDFDDTTFLTDGTILIDVPKLKTGKGTSFYIGSRTGDHAGEFIYTTAEHNTSSVLLGDSKATYISIDMNAKSYFNTDNEFQPYFLLGIGWQRLTIKDNSYNGSVFSDSHFGDGFSFNLGVGMAYFLTPQFFLDGSAIYRTASFSTAEDVEISGGLGYSGFIYSVGIAYIF